MRKHLLGFALFVSLCLPLSIYSQESPRKDDSSSSSENTGGDNLGLKWFNFAVLAVGLGYLVAKHAPAFFNARTDAIQKAIKDATGLKLDADFRASEIDRKMATLSAEISKLRADAQAEMLAEQQRLTKETGKSLAQIQRHEAQEIASLEHNARLELSRHTAELAVSIAASRLRDRLTPADHAALVGGFAGQVSARQPEGAH
jgi:F0F1-type ATP synthase membrane subunit b/b'